MKSVFLILFLLVAASVSAQQVRSVIPYRLIGGKMIVEMKVNGRLCPLIFDTGGQTALRGTLCEEIGLVEMQPKTVVDANGRKTTFPRVMVGRIQTSDDRLAFSEIPVLKLTDELPFDCFQVEGLVGSDLLQYLTVEIDAKARQIILYTQDAAPRHSLRKRIPFVKNGYMPVISLQAGRGNNLPVLFDTGCPSFISLKQTDYQALEGQAAFVHLSEGSGNASIGVAGETVDAGSHRVEFQEIGLGAVRFRNVSSETSTPPFTLLGVKLLEHGKVTVDYPHACLYFEPYGNGEIDLKEKHYDVDLRVKDGDLVVASVWSGMKGVVAVGDKVTAINGRPVRKYDFCESITTGIPELKARKKTRLRVMTADGEKEIIYQKR